MKIDYADLLSGDQIYIDGIGHFRSPKLKELQPTQGIGYKQYSVYVSLFTFDIDNFKKYAQLIGIKGLKALENKTNLNVFDLFVVINETRTMLQDALAFFIGYDEHIIWDGYKKFQIYSSNDELIGTIDRSNFEVVSGIILQLNYIQEENKKSSLKFEDENAKAMWEKAQKYIKEQSDAKQKSQTKYALGNYISKLCCIHNSYNLLNVYELTVFQLYDQFFQSAFLKQMDLQDRIFSIHGGDSYDGDAWLEQINNKKGE